MSSVNYPSYPITCRGDLDRILKLKEEIDFAKAPIGVFIIGVLIGIFALFLMLYMFKEEAPI